MRLFVPKTSSLYTSLILIIFVLLGGCTPGNTTYSQPATFNSNPSYTGEVTPISSFVNLTNSPFTKSSFRNVTSINTWINGEFSGSESITTGTYAATSEGNNINYVIEQNENTLVINFSTSQQNSLFKITGIKAGNTEYNINSPKLKSELIDIENMIKGFFRDFKQIKITQGDTIYNNTIYYSGVRFRVKSTAVGLTYFNGRDTLVADMDGIASFDYRAGKFNGFELIDIETGMTVFSNIYMIFDNSESKLELGQITKLNLPAIGRKAHINAEKINSNSGTLYKYCKSSDGSVYYTSVFNGLMSCVKNIEITKDEYDRLSNQNGTSDKKSTISPRIKYCKREDGSIYQTSDICDGAKEVTSLEYYDYEYYREKEKDDLDPLGNIISWLTSIGMEKYEAEFRSNDISVDILRELKDSDLKEMGINSLGDRKRILKAVK
jgi:hypothetical protein